MLLVRKQRDEYIRILQDKTALSGDDKKKKNVRKSLDLNTLIPFIQAITDMR